MTIQECFEKLGGSYAQVKNRLLSDKLIVRFIAKFPGDGTYADLTAAMQSGRREQAFRAAHTLKGVCGNLGLDSLGNSASALTELLRPAGDAIPPEAAERMAAVDRDYAQAVETIRSFLAEVQPEQ